MYKILLELYVCIYVYMYVLYSKIADEFVNDEKMNECVYMNIYKYLTLLLFSLLEIAYILIII